MREMKKRMKFDSDGDKNINFDEVNLISSNHFLFETNFYSGKLQSPPLMMPSQWPWSKSLMESLEQRWVSAAGLN